MPTAKPRRNVIFTEAELHSLYKLWVERRNPGRRGTPLYIGQKMTLNQMIGEMALERAAEVKAELRKKR